ncbi:MAG: SPFH domain-containing protein [Lachnospira eligens]
MISNDIYNINRDTIKRIIDNKINNQGVQRYFYMEEKVLKKSKNGLAMVTLFILFYAAAIAAIIVGSIMVEQAETKAGWIVLIVAGGVYAAIGWIFFIGLKVLKPQEALVLTLFGKYVGTIKEAGFYFVNPFCVAVNPAASTKLNQSGDVTEMEISDLASMAGVAGMAIAAGNNSQSANKKISLKIMTLSNSRQKINDCLGNPVEIGIAVMWKVTDTAKAVFNVDNYKEYLSLQCDSALRNIVRMYPYDVAENVDTTGDGIADEGSLRGSSEVASRKNKKRNPRQSSRCRT